MADDDDIFVYTGGEAPRDVRRARICESIDTIPRRAFFGCGQLIEVECHNKLKKIGGDAFRRCPSLRRLTKMTGVIEIGELAFNVCTALSDLEFDKLEIVGRYAFAYCHSLRSINMPSVRSVGGYAFEGCKALTDAVFGKGLERIGGCAFYECTALRRIAIPLKRNLIVGADGRISAIVEDAAFYNCENLSRVDVIGGTHETISSLHMKSWRDEMREEIDRINQTLPETPRGIQQWIRSVLDRMEHYKTEHQIVVKEAMTLLELALWKAKLLEEEGGKCEDEKEKKPKKAKIDIESARTEHRVTCGANIVIKNVLPFLSLK
jgi:hypothetical protein